MDERTNGEGGDYEDGVMGVVKLSLSLSLLSNFLCEEGAPRLCMMCRCTNYCCLASILGTAPQSPIFGRRRYLTHDWKVGPTQMPHFEMGTIHFEMGRQGTKFQFGEPPLPNRVCNKIGINQYASNKNRFDAMYCE
jgi:hypothetical protein